jgi:HK97 family phage prohead protease
MSLVRKVVPLYVEDIDENHTRVTASTNELARDGHIVEPAGLQIENFLRSGTILFDHDTAMPVGKPTQAALAPDGSQLSVLVEWAPRGISVKADEVHGLVKADIIRAVSIGFDPIDAEPLDPKRPRGGLHIKTADLLEVSFVSVPADTGAVVTQRSGQSPEESMSNEQRQKMIRSVIKRGMYGVSNLAYVLDQLCYLHSCSTYEEELEADSSKVPAMLGEGLKVLGEALVAMTKEEVAELLASVGEGDDEDLEDGDRSYVTAGKSVITRAFRRGIVYARAGKAVSAANEKQLQRALKHHDRALKHHKDMAGQAGEASGYLDTARTAVDKAAKAHGELGEALQDVKNDPAKATEHVARCMRAHKAVAAQHQVLSDAHQEIDGAQQDAGDSHNAMGRSIKGAQQCVRSVVEGSTTSAENEDGDSKDVQTSAGTGESGGSSNDRNHGAARTRAERIAALELN